MTARIILLVTSPRLPAGLLTAQAWDLVRAHPVFAARPSPLTAALRAAGVTLQMGASSQADISSQAGAPDQATAGSGAPAWEKWTDWAELLLTAAQRHQTVIWLAGPVRESELAQQLGPRLASEPRRAELELVYGSWDPPGARLLDVVSVVDQLVSPGGDPWNREQTHHTLARYLLEECYEAYDAIETGDLTALREELGDLLLQVVLHSRLAQEQPQPEQWSVDDVAGDLAEKMIRRNPHVFAGTKVSGLAEITENWEQIKQAEKLRSSALDGIALAQPALSLAEKILSRAQRAGFPVPPPAAPAAVPTDDPAALGPALLGIVAAARAAGVDAEAALRRAALAHADAVRAAEKAGYGSS